MRYKTYIFYLTTFLYVFVLFTACNNNAVLENQPVSSHFHSQPSQTQVDASSEASASISFSGIASSQESSQPVYACAIGNDDPLQLVEDFLIAWRDDDYATYFGTLTEHRAVGLTASQGYMLSLEIYDIWIDDEWTQIYAQNYGDSDVFKTQGWTNENIIAVCADFNALFDNTKVPTTSGRQTWRFILVRNHADSPWMIFDWGY